MHGLRGRAHRTPGLPERVLFAELIFGGWVSRRVVDNPQPLYGGGRAVSNGQLSLDQHRPTHHVCETWSGVGEASGVGLQSGICCQGQQKKLLIRVCSGLPANGTGENPRRDDAGLTFKVLLL